MSFPNGHLGINVTDIGRSTKFYADVLGLELLGSSFDGPRRFAFLGTGAAVVVTLWEQSQRAFDPQAAGLHHASFQADSMETVRATERRLRNRGVKFLYDSVVPHVEGAESGGIFFEDPDGLRIEVFAPNGAKDLPPVGDAPACGFFH